MSRFRRWGKTLAVALALGLSVGFSAMPILAEEDVAPDEETVVEEVLVPDEETPEGELPEVGEPSDEGPSIDGELPEDELPSDELPEDELPEGELPEDELPSDELPEGELPEEEAPSDDATIIEEEPVSDEETPEGELTEDEIPEADLPEESLPEEETPSDAEAVTEEEPTDSDDVLLPQGDSYEYGNVVVSWSSSKGELEFKPKAGTNGKLSDPATEGDDDWPWASYATEIKTVKFKKDGSTYVVATSCYDMFRGCSNLTELDLTGLDNTQALNFTDMFNGCTKLVTIIVGEYYDVCPNGVPTKSEAFPANPRGYGYWWSVDNGYFVTLSSIRKNHNGAHNADTYKAYASLMSACLIDLGGDVYYTGSAIKLVPHIYMPLEGGKQIELTKGKDFKILGYGADVVNAGSTFVRVGLVAGGMCVDYDGFYREYPYTINPRPIYDAEVEMEGAYDYADGNEVKPEPIITFNGKKLVKGTDYTLSYKNNKTPGKATMTVKGNGNFNDMFEVDYRILDPLKDLEYAEVTGIEDVVFNGTAHTPKPTVTLNGKVLKEGTDYTLSYEDNKRPGIAYVIIKAKEGSLYEGETYASFIVAFTDVPKSFWGYKKVHEAASRGFVHGYSGAQDGMYGPSDNVTRAQAAVILWNMAEKPKPGAGAKDFSDVAADKYYYDAIRWCSEVGVVHGYGSTGTFGPNDLVTRQQLAVMIANYAKEVAGKDASGSSADYASMTDAAQVASWAAPSVGWCFKNGIMSGSGGMVMPGGNATRAQTAKMVCNLFDLVS